MTNYSILLRNTSYAVCKWHSLKATKLETHSDLFSRIPIHFPPSSGFYQPNFPANGPRYQQTLPPETSSSPQKRNEGLGLNPLISHGMYDLYQLVRECIQQIWISTNNPWMETPYYHNPNPQLVTIIHISGRNSVLYFRDRKIEIFLVPNARFFRDFLPPLTNRWTPQSPKRVCVCRTSNVTFQRSSWTTPPEPAFVILNNFCHTSVFTLWNSHQEEQLD